ncbi:MAG: nicotinamide-nucleotide amidohydrolase family protein [Sphingopyxis sp.]|nr:nicotinamide-nucleotide amidohydrolase family protein [Sphingopyxis sp.]
MVTLYQRDIDIRALELTAALAGSDLRIATAESCTGGLLAARLASDARLGPHLDRGYVVYSGESKIDVLGADPDEVAQCDAVNIAVTRSLALGALARSAADIATAVTGFCGPQKDSEEVGLVHVACASSALPLENAVFHFGDIGREHVLERATAAALALTTEIVKRHRGVRQQPGRMGPQDEAMRIPS